MSDADVSAASRYFSDEESAAEHAYIRSLLRIHARMQEIRDTRNALDDEERDLKRRILQCVGVAYGDVVARGNERLLVESCVGDFEYVGEGRRFVAVAYCKCAPETSRGFHVTKRINHTVFDEVVIDADWADA
jgi:hypothetical protein